MCSLWSPAGKELTSWLSFVVYNCKFVTLGQVLYLIASVPDLCTLTYSDIYVKKLIESIEMFPYLIAIKCPECGKICK